MLRGGMPRWITGLARERVRTDRVEKRAFFTNRWLGIALITPQLLLIFTFFYWPAGEALYWAFTLERPWGGGNEWVGFGNFSAILSDPVYWNSIVSSIVFALASTGLGMAMAFALAILTDRELKGYRIYRTVLVWPYAIAAPALGMAFRFILAPEAGFLAFVNKIWPGLWNPALHGTDEGAVELTPLSQVGLRPLAGQAALSQAKSQVTKKTAVVKVHFP